MNTAVDKNGDDSYFDRLLSYFRSQFSEKIIDFVPFRKSVFLLKTEKNTYMIKGYHIYSRLRLQEAFTATLRKEGFSKTYLFVSPPVKEQLFFEGMHWGCMEYIEPNKIPFSFHSQKNRQEGMELLEQFHLVTSTFEARYRTLIPNAHLLEKWSERFNIFLKNLPFIEYFINESFLSEIVSWANWSLTGMEQNRFFFLKEPFAILHGDVAHHNFLRDFAGRLQLIDFDLISIGPNSLDYLQYANRILPFMDWSFNKLARMKQLQPFLNENAFLFALAFPADIFREWNRIIREKTYTDHTKFKQVMSMTIGQFYLRKQFFDQVKNMVT
ncbi:aminoglycoside phosphotransferase family protein [Neobacillus pocheonensis]|uniref:Aminoglycoside phosphotransferase family protein n=1 Tax=Neobacillus pocheonensis TaxID=363869 RepID=A0ABT0W5B2_9BACI|nr:aminoglycoside phosphotransferase family protein [Neobacillus pocheonensis]